MLGSKVPRAGFCVFMFLKSLEDWGNAIFSVIIFSFEAESSQETKIMVMDPQKP